jgi:hypothetical protein
MTKEYKNKKEECMKKAFVVVLLLNVLCVIGFIETVQSAPPTAPQNLNTVGTSPSPSYELVGTSPSQSYEMGCMPGGSMQLVYGQNKIKISFSKASAGGKTAMPGPGQCAWFDRPINASEPSTMEMSVSTPQVKGIVMNSSSSSISLPIWDAEEPLGFFLRAFYNKKLFTVYCYNEGSVLRITRTGH